MTKATYNYDLAALYLRLGLGTLFIIGGLSKLSLLLNSSTHEAMVANYMGSSGYINNLFQQYLFSGAIGEFLSPAGFLTTLSTFELISGIALVVGFMVRPLSLIYAFLLWTFVIALPVMTVPGLIIDVKTYTSPAIFVQIRDIAASGMMFVLFNLSTDKYALDNLFAVHKSTISWEYLGLLLRFSVGAMLVIGGLFGGFPKVPNFATYQWVLTIVGLCMIFGNHKAVKATGVATMLIMLWYIVYKLTLDKGIIANLNGFKREFAFLAAGGTLFLLGGGQLFTGADCLQRCLGYFRPAKISTTDNTPLAN